VVAGGASADCAADLLPWEHVFLRRRVTHASKMLSAAVAGTLEEQAGTGEELQRVRKKDLPAENDRTGIRRLLTSHSLQETLVKQRLNIKNREDVPHDMTLEKLKEKAFEAAEALFKDSTKTAELHTLVVRNMDTPAILTHKSKSKDGHAARGHKAERADSEKPNCSYCAGQGKTGRALLHQFEKCRQKIKDASAASTHEPPKSHRPSRGDDDDAKSTTSHK